MWAINGLCELKASNSGLLKVSVIDRCPLRQKNNMLHIAYLYTYFILHKNLHTKNCVFLLSLFFCLNEIVMVLYVCLHVCI